MRSIFTLFLFLLCFTLTANAGDITLKSGFWGPKYSTDSANYHGVGFGGGLMKEMEGNEEAVKELKKFRRDETISLVLSIPGGFLVGYPLGAALAGNYEDKYDTWLMVGIPLEVAAIVLDLTAKSHLKKSIKIYNEGNAEATSITLSVDYRHLAVTDHEHLLVGIKVAF